MQNLIRAVLIVPFLLGPALAQSVDDATPVYPAGQTVGDYRWALYTACSLVFAAIVTYLIVTHIGGARLGSDIEHLERRIADLEADG